MKNTFTEKWPILLEETVNKIMHYLEKSGEGMALESPHLSNFYLRLKFLRLI